MSYSVTVSIGDKKAIGGYPRQPPPRHCDDFTDVIVDRATRAEDRARNANRARQDPATLEMLRQQRIAYGMGRYAVRQTVKVHGREEEYRIAAADLDQKGKVRLVPLSEEVPQLPSGGWVYVTDLRR